MSEDRIVVDLVFDLEVMTNEKKTLVMQMVNKIYHEAQKKYHAAEGFNAHLAKCLSDQIGDKLDTLLDPVKECEVFGVWLKGAVKVILSNRTNKIVFCEFKDFVVTLHDQRVPFEDFVLDLRFMENVTHRFIQTNNITVIPAVTNNPFITSSEAKALLAVLATAVDDMKLIKKTPYKAIISTHLNQLDGGLSESMITLIVLSEGTPVLTTEVKFSYKGNVVTQRNIYTVYQK